MDLGSGSDFLELMSRKSYSASAAFSVPASAKDALPGNLPSFNIPLDPGFAIRVVALDLLLVDLGSTAKLTMLSAGVVLNPQSGNSFGRNFGFLWVNALVTGGGLNGHWSDPEPFFNTDYSNQGAPAGPVQCLAVADFANSDAAAHNVNLFLQAVVETYKLRLPPRVFLS